MSEPSVLTESKLSVAQVVALIEAGVSYDEVARSYSGIGSAEEIRDALKAVENSDEFDINTLREQREKAKQRLQEQVSEQ